jgi:hypothetical protein
MDIAYIKQERPEALKERGEGEPFPEPEALKQQTQSIVDYMVEELRVTDYVTWRQLSADASPFPETHTPRFVDQLAAYATDKEKPAINKVVAAFLAAKVCTDNNKKAKLTTLFEKEAISLLELEIDPKTFKASILAGEKELLNRLLVFEGPIHPQDTLLGKALKKVAAVADKKATNE